MNKIIINSLKSIFVIFLAGMCALIIFMLMNLDKTTKVWQRTAKASSQKEKVYKIAEVVEKSNSSPRIMDRKSDGGYQYDPVPSDEIIATEDTNSTESGIEKDEVDQADSTDNDDNGIIVDNTELQNTKDNQSNTDSELDPKKALEAYIESSELSDAVSDKEKTDNDILFQENPVPMPKDDLFSGVLDPTAKQEASSSNQERLLSDNAETADAINSDVLTKPIKNPFDKENALIGVEDNEIAINPDATLEEEVINMDTPNLDNTASNPDVPDIKDLNAMLDAIEEEMNNETDNNDTAIDEVTQQLALPKELLETIDTQGIVTNKKPGIIPVKPTDNNEISSTNDNPLLNTGINLQSKDFTCHFEHNINMVERNEVFALTLRPASMIGKPISMRIKKDLELYQYLNMSLEDIDSYPSEFSILKHFCRTMTVQKSVIEDY